MKRSILIIALCILTAGIGLVIFDRRETNDQQQAMRDIQQPINNNQQAVEKSLTTPEKPGERGAETSETEEVSTEDEKTILHDVPFTSQAPNGEWSVPEFQDGCEEASAIMANAWVTGTMLSPASAKKELLDIAAFEKRAIGHSTDTSAADTKRLLLEQYFHLSHVELVEHFEKRDLIAALARGVVIVPMNGRALGNPNFTLPGPLHHMVVVTGYDSEAHEFITNDPGTRKGAGYRYNEDIFFRAARDYPTGMHEESNAREKNMILIERW